MLWTLVFIICHVPIIPESPSPFVWNKLENVAAENQFRCLIEINLATKKHIATQNIFRQALQLLFSWMQSSFSSSDFVSGWVWFAMASLVSVNICEAKIFSWRTNGWPSWGISHSVCVAIYSFFLARCPLAGQAELLVWHLTIFLDFVNLMNVVDLVDLNFYLNIFIISQTLRKFCTKVTQFWVLFMAYA